VPIVYKLAVGPDAKADLAGIWETDKDSAGVLQATLQQIAADQGLLDSLTIKDFGAHGRKSFTSTDGWSSSALAEIFGGSSTGSSKARVGDTGSCMRWTLA